MLKKRRQNTGIILRLSNLVLGLLMPFFTIAQTLAFPGAEGFGRYTSGGRGGQVYIVTNLNDSGEGSLRKGIVKDGPRIIVFAVSGNIKLESQLNISKNDITIAGQTAPGGGITISGYPVYVSADNVIIRYLRFRLGDYNRVEEDAIGGRGAKNIMIDHCSMSWATDEVVSFYRNKDFTMQWCIITEALNESVHEKGAHGYGGIWGGSKASFHHNLIASNNSRNPRFSGSKTTPNPPDEFVDFRNNVIYNWGGNSIYGGESGTYNIVNNYFKSGPATHPKRKNRIVEPWKPYGKYYISGNHVTGFPEVTADNWNGGVQCDNPDAAKAPEEISIENNTRTDTAEEAYKKVLTLAGANLYRDSADLRIVRDTRSGTATVGNGIINSQEEVGGLPRLPKGRYAKDSDGDGMPDDWEKAHALDPDKDDSAQYTLSDKYTNIEVYLNELTKK